MNSLPNSGEPEPDDAGWTATLVPEKEGKTERKRKVSPKEPDRPGIPRYHVLLWDSDDHSYGYVERMLRDLFGHTPEECLKLAKTVDTEGKAVVLTTTKEHAELKRDQILAYGKDESMKNCKGSMFATIEAVE